MEDEFFYCKSKRLFDYLVKHGSKFVKTDTLNGTFVYVFENDDSINTNLDSWESNMKKCLF